MASKLIDSPATTADTLAPTGAAPVAKTSLAMANLPKLPKATAPKAAALRALAPEATAPEAKAPNLASRDSLALLHDVSLELASILDRQKLLERVAVLVKRLIDYQLFSVMLWDADQRYLLPAVAVHQDGCRSLKPRVALDEGLCGTAATFGRPVRVNDVLNDPRYIDCGDGRVRSELVVPMLIKGRLIGVIDLESYDVNAFGPQAEKLLEILAANLAVALENARLYEEKHADERRLAADLSAARKVQQLLLPRSSPWLPGVRTAVAWSPARHLGGDLYDFLPYDEHTTAYVIADVAGKGTGAALYGAMAIGMLRGYAAENACDPQGLLSYLNDELVQMRVDRRFLAVTYALYDRRDHSLTIANAGLPYPYLIRNGQVTQLPLFGLPVGAMAAAEYEQTRLELAPGDTVVFTTDGIEELLDANNEPFGEERILETLGGLHGGAATSIADGLLAASDQHLASVCEPSDDRTVVVVQRDS